jgi:WD40 repeat protein
LFACFKKIIEFDLQTAKVLKAIPAHESSVSCLIEIENQYHVVSGGFDGSIILWDSISWKQKREHIWGGWIYGIMPIK